MADPKDRLELFMLRYKELRTAQNAYFNNGKMQSDLKEAKAKEAICDRLFKQLIKEGYNPENATNHITQPSLFK